MESSVMKDLPRVKGELLENYNLANFTRFKTGGMAEVFFSPKDKKDLIDFLKHAPKDMPIHILGFGSNVLIRDGILNGITIRLQSEAFNNIEIAKDDNCKVVCGAFASNIALSKFAMENKIKGFEFLFGIPGSIGGAILTNAGCFKAEVKDILLEIEIVNKLNGEVKTIPASECGLVYRDSSISPDYIITSVVLKGVVGDSKKIQEKMDKILKEKDAAQPTYTKTAGSTFKNPEGHSAWKLIKDAGCQGLKLGGAIISPLHANFIINENEATSADIEELAEKVRYAVYEKFGIMLEYEIKIIGSRKVENP
ncbi:MAG: UDP-N-acetylmuramate dehydrogenase [Alphaproteobacteria bacterium]